MIKTLAIGHASYDISVQVDEYPKENKLSPPPNLDEKGKKKKNKSQEEKPFESKKQKKL